MSCKDHQAGKVCQATTIHPGLFMLLLYMRRLLGSLSRAPRSLAIILARTVAGPLLAPCVGKLSGRWFADLCVGVANARVASLDPIQIVPDVARLSGVVVRWDIPSLEESLLTCGPGAVSAERIGRVAPVRSHRSVGAATCIT